MRRLVNLCVLAAFVALLGGCALLHGTPESSYMQRREQYKSYN
jgi:hypothetical protein